jgi:hypothetical protein
MLGLRVFGVIKEMHMSAKKYEGCWYPLFLTTTK